MIGTRPSRAKSRDFADNGVRSGSRERAAVLCRSRLRYPVGPRRRGMLLVVCLAIIALLALLGASFSFQMNADLASVNAINDLQQARQAAWSGIDRVLLVLREERTNVEAWWHNPDQFRRSLVWAPDQEGGSESLADQEIVEGRPAWRYSIVNYELDGDETKIRYGITDEAGKIHLNIAPRAQLLALFDQLELEDVTSEQLADCLIDWRDEDNTTISLNGAESSYYMTLNPPYRAKNRPLQTVEELLMVKHFDGQILYGEDYNRNGYLDENEDDGEDGVFPPDDGDGVLDRGILPFVTVHSWDWNWGNDNKRRMPIGALNSKVLEQIPEYVTEEMKPEVLEFIAEANARGYKFRSVGELLELEVYENGVSNYTEAWDEYDRLAEAAENDRLELEEPEEEEEDRDEFEGDDLGPDDGGEAAEPEEESRSVGDGSDNNEDEEGADPARSKRDVRSRRKSLVRGAVEEADDLEKDAGSDEGRRRPRLRRPGADRESDTGGKDSRRPGSTDPESEGLDPSETEEGPPEPKGTPIVSPVTAEDMPVLMDRLTAEGTQAVAGLINVNTAPPQVLKTIPGLSEDDVDSIVSTRTQLDGESKMTTAWLVTSGALDPQTFALVCNKLTTRSIQFTIDVVGFADHVGTFKRIQAVVEMRGHLSQIKYYRDITSLGMGYPVRDDERSDQFAFEDF